MSQSLTRNKIKYILSMFLFTTKRKEETKVFIQNISKGKLS